MIDALITGKLFKQPERKTSKNGKAFVIAMLRVMQQDGGMVFAKLVAFDAVVCGKMMALHEGESVSVAGSLALSAYADKEGNSRPGMDMVVHDLLTVYHVRRKRDAMQQPAARPAPARPVPAPAAGWERMYQRNGNTGGGLEDDPL